MSKWCMNGKGTWNMTFMVSKWSIGCVGNSMMSDRDNSSVSNSNWSSICRSSLD